MAEMIQSRNLEISPNNAEALAKIGVLKLYKNEIQESYAWFAKALKSKRNQPRALHGLKALYKKV